MQREDNENLTGDRELEKLRAEIDSIDRKLVALLANRADTVKRVANLKKKRGLPVYHPAREEDLISDRREQAGVAGLNPDMVEALFRTVMRGSRVSQTATISTEGVRKGARVLVVGGRGEMGASLVRWFAGAGYVVSVLDRDDWERVEEHCEDVALAILSVPIETTGDVADRLAPHLPNGCILADITSLKSEPLARMMKAYQGPVTGLHPMFGPTTPSLDKQIVVVTPGRNPDQCRWLLDQLSAWGAILVPAEAEEHDRIMAFVQALRHFATFAFGQFLCAKEVDLERTLEFSSPIYRLELGMVGRLFAQDPELYAEIIFADPERIELVAQYIKSVDENIDMIRRGDKDEFLVKFRAIADWFGPFGDQAIRESSYLIDKMVERF